MKLEDFSRVSALVSDREYLKALKARLHMKCRVRIGDYDIHPDLAEKMMPEMQLVIEQQIQVVDQKLAELGVTVE